MDSEEIAELRTDFSQRRRTEFYPKIGKVTVINRTKEVYKNYKSIGQEYWDKETNRYLLVGRFDILDSRK